jgi:hypothetical protein
MSPSLYTFLSGIPWLVTLKKKMDTGEMMVWRVKQLHRRWRRKYRETHPLSHSYRFCILSVKRTEYVDFAIHQINSLHFYNPYHVFDILCDDKCLQYLKANRHRLDYPQNTRFISLVENTTESWQHYKIQAVIYAIERDGILMDADMYWYSDPLVRQWQALFFAQAYFIKDQKPEQQLVTSVFNHPEWGKFPHYTTGVFYLPYRLYSPDLKINLQRFIKMQSKSTYSFLKDPEKRTALRRLTDEMAINLAVQTALRPEQITTLKGTDSPGDRRIVLSLYYGSMNSIIS